MKMDHDPGRFPIPRTRSGRLLQDVASVGAFVDLIDDAGQVVEAGCLITLDVDLVSPV